MKNEEVLVVILVIILSVIIGFLLAVILYANAIGKVEKENAELKTQNERLEKIVKELDIEQAEQTKRTAERNGVGG